MLSLAASGRGTPAVSISLFEFVEQGVTQLFRAVTFRAGQTVSVREQKAFPAEAAGGRPTFCREGRGQPLPLPLDHLQKICSLKSEQRNFWSIASATSSMAPSLR